MKKLFALTLMMSMAAASWGVDKEPGISGDYLEVRSCDVYTGPCVANGEMGLRGKEGILVWSIREGSWNGTPLAGLSVIAALRADDTLGDQRYNVRSGPAVLVVDDQATTEQRDALVEFARSMAGKLIREVADVQVRPIEATLGTCSNSGCASVKAGELVEVTTRCLGSKDHLCGNEETYYPPLTTVNGGQTAFTELAKFKGEGLDVTWELTGYRSAFLASFTR